VGYLSYHVELSSDELYSIIIKAVLLLVCIGIVEFLFLKIIVSNYLSVNPNIPKQHIVNKFRSLQTTRTLPIQDYIMTAQDFLSQVN
jgi:hypothetical protein